MRENDVAGHPDIAKRVEEWYGKNVERMATRFKKVEFSKNEWDPRRGGVLIEIVGQTLVATIAFWFKGDVAVQVLRDGADTPSVLEDRVLNPNEDIDSLLDRYLEKIDGL